MLSDASPWTYSSSPDEQVGLKGCGAGLGGSRGPELCAAQSLVRPGSRRPMFFVLSAVTLTPPVHALPLSATCRGKGSQPQPPLLLRHHWHPHSILELLCHKSEYNRSPTGPHKQPT